MCNACILQSLHLSIAPSDCPSFRQLVCYRSRGSCFTSITTLFSSNLSLSVCPSAVVLPNSQLLPSNESISIINRSVIESVSLLDRPLVSWLNKENSSSTRERQSVIITLMLLRLLVKRIKNHLCALLLCRALSLEYQSKKARPNHRLRNIMQMLSSTFFWGSPVR